MNFKNLFFIVLMFSLFSCGSDDNPDYTPKKSSGEIYVNGEVMPVNHAHCRVRMDEYYFLVYITQADSYGTNSFRFYFKRSDYVLKEGDITNDIGAISITNFMSADTYLASGSVTLVKYDEKNQYMTLKFNDVVFKDRKIISSILTLKGEIKFPIRDTE